MKTRKTVFKFTILSALLLLLVSIQSVGEQSLIPPDESSVCLLENRGPMRAPETAVNAGNPSPGGKGHDGPSFAPENEQQLAPAAISNGAYAYLAGLISFNRSNFYIYQDADSGFNHSFPSGFYGGPPSGVTTVLSKIHVNAGCIDDPNSSSGCSNDPCLLDQQPATVLSIAFDPLAEGEWVGVNFEEPEDYGTQPRGQGYDLQGATSITFYARSPSPGGSYVQFGVNQQMSAFYYIPNTWTSFTINFSEIGLTQSDLVDVHLPFAVATKDIYDPSGVVVLLDNIMFLPVPASQTSRSGSLSLPVSTQTFGELPQSNVPFPTDQVNRNAAAVYESALTLMALLRRGTSQDLQNAGIIADALDYALFNDNHGDPLPIAPSTTNPVGCYDGNRAPQCGLHNAYSSGDIALFNNQLQGPATAGDVRLAGFTCGISPTGYCLMLDGATGGNNAFAMLSLLEAYDKLQDPRYLEDARAIGSWIFANLLDTSGTGYGGYFAGYPDGGVTKVANTLNQGKSTENNADIFAAFTRLAGIETSLGNVSNATTATNRANIAGDFVMKMFDSSAGRFYSGTVPVGTQASNGICPNGPQTGQDVINTCDFLDTDTFTTLAMASSARYGSQINWKLPVQYLLSTFAQRVTVDSQAFCGFDIVAVPTSGPNGVAWEFTGQAVATSKFVGVTEQVSCSGETPHSYVNEIALAQTSAPFGNGQGLVAGTMQDGDQLCAADQCLETPFQCIPERVGLAATNWAIFAEQGINIFMPPPRDMLWAGAGGSASIWTLDSSNNYTTYTEYAPYNGWTPVSYSYNPTDGTRSLLWAGTGGYASIWTLDGSNNFTTDTVYGPYSGWTPVSYSSNSDGTRTLLWAGTGGYASIWTLNSSNNFTTDTVYGPYSGWTPVSYSSNSDGTRSLLWAGPGGSASIWTLNGSNNYTTSTVYGPYSDWTPVSYSSNSDGTRSLLWAGTGGYASIWTLNGSNSYITSTVYGPYSGWTPVQYQ
jgi:hypothetical protein